ncbi:hypothetical protein C8J56DRAFT_1037748 [Mycena floridula]|nr:hypothetical protein C8J56DRAFT_1037748 [Mycena floridula]
MAIYSRVFLWIFVTPSIFNLLSTLYPIRPLPLSLLSLLFTVVLAAFGLEDAVFQDVMTPWAVITFNLCRFATQFWSIPTWICPPVFCGAACFVALYVQEFMPPNVADDPYLTFLCHLPDFIVKAFMGHVKVFQSTWGQLSVVRTVFLLSDPSLSEGIA